MSTFIYVDTIIADAAPQCQTPSIDRLRFRGLAKNTAHVITLFALSNLWMARRRLMAMTG